VDLYSAYRLLQQYIDVMDLNTLSGSNELIKFADDSTLLVPEDSDTDLETEFNNILAWAITPIVWS